MQVTGAEIVDASDWAERIVDASDGSLAGSLGGYKKRCEAEREFDRRIAEGFSQCD